MVVSWLRSVLARMVERKSGSGRRRRAGSRWSSYRIWFEQLENRWVPASTWTGNGANALWSNSNNWSGGTPNGGVDVIFPATATQLASTDDVGSIVNLTFQGGGYTINTSGSTALSVQGAITFSTGSSNVTINPNITCNTGTVTNSSTATLIFNGTANTNNGGPWRIRGTGNVTYANTVTNSAGGSPGIQKGASTSDSGTLTLSGANTFGNGVTINGGAVVAKNNTALGSSSGAVTVNAGTALQLQGSIAIANGMTLSGTGTNGNGALESLGGANSCTGAISIGPSNGGSGLAATIQNDDTSNTLTLTSASSVVSNNSDTVTFQGNGNISVAGAVKPNGTSILTKAGSGTLTLSSTSNTYTGGTNLNGGTISVSANTNLGNSGGLTFGGGTLQITGSSYTSTSRSVTLGAGGGAFNIPATQNFTLTTTSSIGNSSSGPLGIVTSSSTLKLTGASNTVGSLTGTGNLSLPGSGSLTIGVDGSNKTYSGAISGTTANLTKVGNGTETFSGANTYSGATTISAGVLLAANTTGSAAAAVTVNAGGTLGSTGTLATVGAITASGGTVGADLSPSTLTAGSANFTSSGTLLLDVTGYTSGLYDVLNLGSGALTLDTSSKLKIDVHGLATSGTVNGVIVYGSRTGTFAAGNISFLNNSSGLQATLTFTDTGGGAGQLNISLANNVATATTVTSSVNPAVFGQNVAFTATVNVVAPATGTVTGTVTFLDGTATLGTLALSGGTATYPTSSLAIGTHTISAVYAAQANFLGSSSANLLQTIGQANTTTVFTSLTNPSVFGQAVTITATVGVVGPGAGTPTGTVTFKDGGVSIGTGGLTSGVATFPTSSLSVASHTFTTVYGGDTNFTGSTAGAFVQTVGKASSSTTVTSAPNSSVFGQTVTFTATVTAAGPGSGTPTGIVTFEDSGTSIGTGNLSSGVATYATSSLSVASHTITVVYNGDTNFLGNTSASILQTVGKASSNTVVTSSPSASTFGQTVTFTATVSAVGPGAGRLTGTVTFEDGVTSIGTGGISSGVATFPTSILAAGSHTITAVYGGDANFTGSTSGSLVQSVSPAGTSTVISSSLNPANQTQVTPYQTQPVTFTAVVTNSSTPAIPAGTVTFEDSGSSIGSATLSSGVGTLTTQLLAVGTHTIAAIYNDGSANFTGSTSTNTVAQIIRQLTTTALTSAPDPSVLNRTVSFTATVTGSTSNPTAGSITFLDGSTVLGSFTLSNGTATLTTSSLSVGDHTLTAVYGGDATTSAGSSSAPLTQTVLLNTLSWTGLGTNPDTTPDPNWSDPNNWDKQVTPIAGDDLVFPTSTGPLQTTNNNDIAANTIFHTISFTGDGTLTYDIGGNAVDLSAGISDQAGAGADTFNPNMTLTAAQGFTAGAGTALILGGAVDNGGFLLTIAGAGNTTVNGIISGNNGLIKSGAGTLLLNSANGYAGTTSISAGLVEDGVTNALPTGSSLVVNAPAQLDIAGFDQRVGGLNGNGTITDSGTARTATFTVNDGGLDIFSGSISDLNSGGGGALRLVKSGPGTLGLSGINTYAGGSNLGGGVTVVNNNGSLGNTGSGAVTIASATLEVSSTCSISGIFLLSGVSTIQVDANQTFTLGGTIADGNPIGTLNKTGPGTLLLTGTGSYTGNTTINGGALLVQSTGSIPGTLSVNGSNTLGGTGTVGSIVASGTVSPGFSPGTLAGSSADLSSGGTLLTQVEGYSLPGTDYDRLDLGAGALTLGGTSKLTLDLAGLSAPGTAQGIVLYGTGNLTGTFASVTVINNPHHLIAAVNYDQSESISGESGIDVTITAPTTTTVSSSGNPSIYGNSVTLTATVTGTGGTPTGTVTFSNGSATLGTGVLSSGTATISTTSLTVGNHTITATYGGDANYLTSTGSLTQTVQADTSTTLTFSDNAPVFDEAVTFTATVSVVETGAGTPVGTVTFQEGASTLATAALNGAGTATFTTSSLALGGHTITASYGGASGFLASSDTKTLTIAPAGTSTTVSSSLNPSVFGQNVSFTATVNALAPSAAIPTGTVTFEDGTSTLAVAPLGSNGTATFSTSSLTAGNHAVTAVYTPTSNFLGSSGAQTQTVTQAGTTTILTSNLNPSIFGQSVTFSVTVSAIAPGAGTPAGTVTFENGGTSIGTGSLSSGATTFTTVNLPAGTQTITAIYGGDVNFTSSTSTALPQTINQAATTTALGSSASTTVFGQLITFTAAITIVAPGGGTPTGTVTFSEGANTLALSPVSSNGTATFSTSTLAAGSHTITAAYGGDANFTGSTSNTSPQTISQAGTTNVLLPSANPGVVGQPVVLTTTISAIAPGSGAPTGTITFDDGGASIGTGILTSGVATFTASSLSVGSHTLTSVYAGDANFTGSTSATLLQTVIQANTTSTLVSTPNPSVAGTPVTFSVTVNVNVPGGGTLTGTVTFLDSSTSMGTGAVDGSARATLTTSSLSQGNHQITAVYGGDGNFLTSTSATLSQVVTTGSLQVSTFTATTTGFTAVFNRAINVGTINSPILNLYDNSSGTLGPADVTLVGTTAGAIRGSLVVDPTGTHIAFIQTGQTGVGPAALKGVLPNDTYTVTLRSASNGFKDIAGNLLDGNADGTPGDNFVTTFVVNNSTNSVTVSLPDFARGAGQNVDVPNNIPGSGIPLRLLNNANTAVTITSTTFNLAYDSTLLTVNGAALAGGVPGDASFTLDTSTAGLAIITFNTPTGVVLTGGGSQNFLDLTATVPSTAGYAEKEILDLQNIQINNGTITAIDDAAIHVAGYLGDTTRDEIYTGLDAQRISRVAVGLDPGFRQWLLADPLIIGDASGDNQLTGLDALEVARQAVGITQSTIPPLPAVTPAIVGPDPVLSIPTDFTAKPQASVLVPVNLDHSDGLASVNLAIAYDTSRVDVASAADVKRGSLTQSFDNFTVNIDRTAGIIRIRGYRTAGPLIGLAGGSLAAINFRIKDNAPAGPAIINLLQNAGATWSLPGGTDAQGNDFLFDLQPRLSNRAGDPLDGVINVTPAARSLANPITPVDPASRAGQVRLGSPDLQPEASNLDDVGRIANPSYAVDAAQRLIVNSTVAALMHEDLGWANRRASAPEDETGINEKGLDDFFSRYAALGEDGGQRLLIEKELATLTADDMKALFSEVGDMKVPAWLEDVQLP